MREFRNAKHIALVIRLLGGRSGGAERIYCELANFLVEDGYRVTCLHFDSKDTPPFYPIDSRAEVINLYAKTLTARQRRSELISRLKFLPNKVRNQAAWDRSNDLFVAQLRDYFRFVQPDVAVSLMPPANTPALIAVQGSGVQVVATNHNVPKEDYESPFRWDQNPVDRELRLKVLDNAAAIHVLFPRFGDWFPAHLQDKITPIPNYISPEFRASTVQPKREKLILAVGRLAEVKNYMQLVRSWNSLSREFPDWKVLIYGTGPQLNELKSEIHKLDLGGSITLGGHRADLSTEYARASIFCHPAHFEGFGLSPAEALYMGVPVVAYADCPGVNEFVKHEINGLAVTRDGQEDGLADGLRRLIEDEELRLQLGLNGPISVGGFTLERYRNNWVGLIEKLTAEAA